MYKKRERKFLEIQIKSGVEKLVVSPNNSIISVIASARANRLCDSVDWLLVPAVSLIIAGVEVSILKWIEVTWLLNLVKMLEAFSLETSSSLGGLSSLGGVGLAQVLSSLIISSENDVLGFDSRSLSLILGAGTFVVDSIILEGVSLVIILILSTSS